MTSWWPSYEYLEYVLIAAITILVLLWWISGVVAKRFGNTGDPGTCIKCGARGSKAIPRTAEAGKVESLLDGLFDRRLHGRPQRLRVDHLFDDRRFCVTCYREERGVVEAEQATARHDILVSNDRILRTLLDRENARRAKWYFEAPAPKPTELPVTTREPTESKPIILIPTRTSGDDEP